MRHWPKYAGALSLKGRAVTFDIDSRGEKRIMESLPQWLSGEFVEAHRLGLTL
jgi:hypothetical protein